MKKCNIARTVVVMVMTGMAGAIWSTRACADGSLTVSGLLDAGVSYINNTGGASTTKFDDGILAPNLLKFDGTEDLGGGTRAIFNLTSQFLLGSGSYAPGQNLFSRNAYVGLSDARLGKIMLGNQYDFMTDSLFFNMDEAAVFASGIYDFRNGPFNKLALPNNPTGAFDWDRMSGERVQNAIKYTSPTIGGFSAGVLYGFGNVAGSVGAGNAQSIGLNYENGPFGINAAWTLTKTATDTGAQDSVHNWGVGTHYQLGPVLLTTLYTGVRNELNGAAVWQAEFGSQWQIGPQWSLAGAYSYMKGNDGVDNNHAHQLSALLSYIFSRRTSVYVAAVWQRANEGANAQICGTMVASSTPSQFIGRIGLLTRF